jgi:uncharacterized membrane protein
LGALVTVTLILFLGILTRGVATRRFLAAWENIFVKIPIFRGVYTAVQKLVQTFLGQSENSRQVVMIEYPRKGIYTVGFAMGRAWRELENKQNAQLVPTAEISPLDMTMEEALKLITSGGLITPDDKSRRRG